MSSATSPPPAATGCGPDIDWENWTPAERAILCFVFAGDRVLLIRKKRGLGAGKINGPGGRIDPGETPVAAAIRETEEEVRVRPLDPVLAGELHFQFVDGYGLHCAVFRAAAHEGAPAATAEADPFWAPVANLPFDEMWADDRHWFPWLLAGRPFRGYFVFDGDRMLSHRVC